MVLKTNYEMLAANEVAIVCIENIFKTLYSLNLVLCSVLLQARKRPLEAGEPSHPPVNQLTL